MTTATPSEAARGRHIDAPRRHGPRLHCPRCESRLLFDGDEYLCMACGYEFPADQLADDVRRDLDRAGHARHALMGLGAGLVVGGVVARGLGLVAWIGVAGVVGVVAAAAAAAASARLFGAR